MRIYFVNRKCKQLIYTNAQISRIRWQTSKVTLHWVVLCCSRTASFQIRLYFPLQQSLHFNTWSPQTALQSRWRNDLLLCGGCDGVGLSLYIGGIDKNPCRHNRAGCSRVRDPINVQNTEICSRVPSDWIPSSDIRPYSGSLLQGSGSNLENDLGEGGRRVSDRLSMPQLYTETKPMLIYKQGFKNAGSPSGQKCQIKILRWRHRWATDSFPTRKWTAPTDLQSRSKQDNATCSVSPWRISPTRHLNQI